MSKIIYKYSASVLKSMANFREDIICTLHIVKNAKLLKVDIQDENLTF